jgi:hypothetical protein
MMCLVVFLLHFSSAVSETSRGVVNMRLGVLLSGCKALSWQACLTSVEVTTADQHRCVAVQLFGWASYIIHKSIIMQTELRFLLSSSTLPLICLSLNCPCDNVCRTWQPPESMHLERMKPVAVLPVE